jgi:hypothetical protein
MPVLVGIWFYATPVLLGLIATLLFLIFICLLSMRNKMIDMSEGFEIEDD